MSLDQNLQDFLRWRFSRRTALKAGVGAALSSQALLLQDLSFEPARPALAATSFSDIQFDVGRFLTQGPSVFNDGGSNVVAQFGPIFMLLTPARLTRNPTKADQATLANGLATIESVYNAAPSGVLIASVSYGVPYFARLPQSLVAAHMPRLLSNTNRFALEEAVAGPTDVVNGVVQGANGTQPKERFMVNVVIERNDLLFQLRSDSTFILNDVITWLQGSNSLQGKQIPSPALNGLLAFGTPRLQFVQMGMPRRVADAAAQANPNLYEFHTRINQVSSMVMGFVDQQVDSSAPTAQTVTFVGDSHAKLTTANPGDYFDNGSICHFSHDIDDLYQFYQTAAQDPTGGGGEPASERIQYMFRSNQVGSGFFGLPEAFNANDPFTNGGAPSFVNNVFQGTNAALLGAIAANGAATKQINDDPNKTFNGQQRLGHEAALQRSSRAADGTPLHIRNDGPGFDGMDVPAFDTFPGQPNISTHAPAGTNQFKLQFLVFVPTAEFFRVMRVNVGAQDIMAVHGQPNDPNGTSGGVQFADNGLERFITATRRQNFLVPPRRHRAFPLLELT
jgi:hypothetical protein